MRITSEVMVTRSLDRLQTRLQQYERTQSELATGRRILKPSDDPSGSRRASSLTGAMQGAEQHLRNIDDANGWISSADSQLQSGLTRLHRAREIATRGSSDTTPAERSALATEVEQIREELEGIANTQYRGRPLFGGFTDGNAVQPDGGAWATNGDGDQIMRRVSDSETVRVNVTAGEWLGEGDDNALAQLDELAAALRAGEPITGRITGLEAASDRVADSLAVLGASANRISSAEMRAQDLLQTMRTELSGVQDVDLAQGIMELQIQQVAYEATLSALGQSLPPNLGAFLR